MKKRIFSVLLVAAMLVSMIVVPAYAQEQTETKEAVGYCQHCKQVIPQDQWRVWNPTDTGPRTGHYYLDGDMSGQEKQITINLDDDLMRNVICLDLRGRTYAVEGVRPFLIYGIFSIMDSVGGGEISVTGQTGNANGAFCQMGKSKNSKNGAGELNVYSGTLRRVNSDDCVVATGGLIYLGAGSTLNLYGGKLIGGETNSRKNSSGSQVKALGGTIHATASYINLYGGVVTGGVANDGFVTGADGTVTEYDAAGGNIYAEKSSVILIDGGKVENGYSGTSGGNIELQASTLEIRSGSVVGGYSYGASGNINIGGKSTFIMSGGVVKNGVCKTTGGNLRVNNAGATLDISGGEIYGDIYAGLYKSFKLSGAPKIYMGLSNGLRLVSTANATKLDVAGLTEGAQIYLDGVDQVFTDVLEEPQTYLGYFKDAIRADISVDETGALKVAKGTTGFCPHCWQTGEQATWTAWHNKEDSEDATALIKETKSKHYYLSNSITRTGIVSIGTSSSTAADIVFDMNGKTWTTTNKKVFNLYAKLSLIDSVGSGLITGDGSTTGANGGVIMGSESCSFSIYSGMLSRTVNTGEEKKPALLGGILYMSGTGSTVNVYGGTVINGIAAIYNTDGGKGGNIYAGGVFNMTAGAIIGGKAYANSYKLGDVNQPLSSVKPGLGGNVYVYGTVDISGGHIIGGNATQGGNIYASSSTKSIAISDCVIRDGVANETDAFELGLLATSAKLNSHGGNIYFSGGSNCKELELSNVIVRSGFATGGAMKSASSKREAYGGNIYITKATLTLRNTIVSDGVAGNATGDDGRGGNLYFTSTGACDVYDSVIGNGYSYSHGGNVYGPGGVSFTLHSGLIIGGQTGTYGGNLYCSGFNMEGGIVTGGVSGGNGGNVFVYETEEGKTTNYLKIEAVEGKPAPIISNGSAGSYGGNIAVRSSSAGTITGAIIENGKGDTKNNYSAYNADNLYGGANSVLTVTDTVIKGIDNDANNGNGIYTDGTLTLQGNTQVINEEKNSCVFVAATGKLTVDESFTGEAAVTFAAEHFANVEEPQGGNLAEQNTATGVFTGKLYLDGQGSYDYGLPAIFAEAGDSKLYVASTSVVKGDEILWYRDAQSAVAAAKDGYIRLYATSNTIEMNGDLTVDVNGNGLTVTGSGMLYGFDSANDDYEGYGIVTADGVSVAPAFLAPNGNQYVTITSAEGTSFHRMGVCVSNVALRPSVAGIYFYSTWACDSLLQERIKSYGIAVSTQNMPGADFATDLDTLYTVESSDTFVSGKSQPSVLIANILKPSADNAMRGTTEIYATSYVVIDDGSENGMPLVIEDNGNGGVTYSMRRVLEKVDLVWPKLTETQQTAMKALYDVAPEAMDTWGVYNLVAAVKGTASVRPLKILTLGHSLAVDSAHMLNLVAATQGYDQPMVVATLYESGCRFDEHVSFLTNDTPAYNLYLSYTETPNVPPVTINSVTMKFALEYDDWDIIIMQGGVFEIADEAKYQPNVSIIKEYVRQHVSNPNFIFAWHMPWVTPVDNDLRDQYPYSPNSYYVNYEKYGNERANFYKATVTATANQALTDDSFIYFIPSGTAIENALSSYLTEKDLHRDYAHVTDLGRLIASYTWYCTLVGLDHLDEVKLDAIPKAFLKSTADKTQDRVLTESEKAIILEAVNNALANPLEMTQSQYTEAP